MKAALIFLSVGSSVVSVTSGWRGNACCRCCLLDIEWVGWMDIAHWNIDHTWLVSSVSWSILHPTQRPSIHPIQL